eukprot:354000_1
MATLDIMWKDCMKSIMWKDCMESIMQLGFTKVTIINRTNYETILASSPNDIANMPNKWTQINENEELSANWGDVTKTIFGFYGRRFRILLRDDFPCIELIKQTNNLLTFGYVRTDAQKQSIDDITNIICSYVCDINYDANRMKIIQSKKICKYIVGLHQHEIIIAYQFKTVWFVAYGTKKKMSWRANHTDRGTFAGAQHAWTKIHRYFQQLEKNEL